MEKNKIVCPKCKTEINISDVLKNQLETELKSKYDKEKEKLIKDIEVQKKFLENEKSEIKEQKASLNKKKENLENLLEEKVKEKLSNEKRIIEQKIKKEIAKEKEDEIKALNEELNEKSKQIQETNKLKAQLAKTEREKTELKEKIKAESEQKLNEILKKERAEIKKNAERQSELKIKELEKKLEDNKKMVDELKKKQEQGSMQLQGEVQELAIEKYLKTKFTLDTIEEIGKGARGADCIQTVNTREIQNCGTIYYESKRTKNFDNKWIEKFKSDMREKNTNIGVLVTDVYPKNMERMGLKDGIWICSYEEFKGLSEVLRESIIQIKTMTLSQENKGDKMNLIYNYLTSNEFKNQFEAIVEGFVTMQEDLNKEKRAMDKIWKEREKQIQKVITNTTSIYGSIKGIAGKAIQNIESLEFPNQNLLEENNN